MEPKGDWEYEEDNSKANPKAGTASIFELMDEFAKTVEIFTGFKKQFTDAGWDEKIAEAMVLHFLQTTAAQHMKGL